MSHFHVETKCLIEFITENIDVKIAELYLEEVAEQVRVEPLVLVDPQRLG